MEKIHSMNQESGKENIIVPELPQIAKDVSRLTNDPSGTLEDVRETIRDNPSMTNKIMKIVDSDFFDHGVVMVFSS